MTLEISYRFGFDAAHHFDHFPVGHPNRGMHGHSFQVEVAIAGEVGSTIAVGAELVRLEVAGEGDQEVAAAPREAKAPAAASPAAAPPQRMPSLPPERPAEPQRPAPPARGSLGPPRPPGEKPLASPAVRRRALEAGVDLRQVRGSSPAGRITHDEALKRIEVRVF